MSPEQVLLWAQICVSIITLGGLAFSTGRLYGRIEALGKDVREVKDSLFGPDSQFLRREASELMMANATRERDALDRRLTDFGERLSAIEHK
jgi:hypothetical protein